MSDTVATPDPIKLNATERVRIDLFRVTKNEEGRVISREAVPPGQITVTIPNASPNFGGIGNDADGAYVFQPGPSGDGATGTIAVSVQPTTGGAPVTGSQAYVLDDETPATESIEIHMDPEASDPGAVAPTTPETPPADVNTTEGGTPAEGAAEGDQQPETTPEG